MASNKQLKTKKLYYRTTEYTFFTYALLLVIFHIALALILLKNRQLATAYALGISAISLITLSLKKPFWSLYFLSYIINGHVLWRMTKAHVFWEYSKYVGTILLILITIRYVKKIRFFLLPTIFILLLLLSVPLTINYYNDFTAIREELAFNLSGPILLGFTVLFLRNFYIPEDKIKKVLLSLILPVVSISTIALYNLLTHRVVFTETSNFTASGGFGPNQVSAVLGLGALIGLTIATNHTKSLQNRILFYTLGMWFFIQSILTFSRSGPFNFIISLMIFIWIAIKDKKIRFRALSSTTLILFIFIAIFPKLQSLTQNKVKARFTNLNPTGRDKIALAELKLFKEHPLFGVGPGVGIEERSRILGYSIASHTEYTRLLGEHGVFGLFALLLLIYMLIYPVKFSKNRESKAENAAYIAWVFLEMAHSATRIAITGFLPGIAYLNLQTESGEHEDNNNRPHTRIK